MRSNFNKQTFINSVSYIESSELRWIRFSRQSIINVLLSIGCNLGSEFHPMPLSCWGWPNFAQDVILRCCRGWAIVFVTQLILWQKHWLVSKATVVLHAIACRPTIDIGSYVQMCVCVSDLICDDTTETWLTTCVSALALYRPQIQAQRSSNASEKSMREMWRPLNGSYLKRRGPADACTLCRQLLFAWASLAACMAGIFSSY